MPAPEDLGQVLVRDRIHRDADRLHAFRYRLLHCHARVLVEVTPVAAVVVVLWAAVGEYEQQPPPALHAIEAGGRMPYRGAHARRQSSRHAPDLAADVVR